MTFAIELSPQASRFIRRLPQAVAARILGKLGQIRLNPFRYLDHYEGKASYKIRIGSYRALCDLDSGQRIIWVRMIDKRSRIYKRHK